MIFFFSMIPTPAVDHVLAEVVVCAVGWVETLPAMEMTAQATALPVLVLYYNGRMLCAFQVTLAHCMEKK